MAIRNLDKIFRPRSVAVIGASDDPSKVGFTVFRNLIEGGFPGPLCPVNARRKVVQGKAAVPHVRDLAESPDLAVVCTPAAAVPAVIDDCGAAGIRGIVILSAGFREAGPAGRALEDQVRNIWQKYDGMRIVGPNCLGVLVPGAKLNASFAADAPLPGHIALISQSGALCTSLLDWALQERIGFSHFVSVGNMLDVGFGDLIDYFGQDPITRSMILYLESVNDARGFVTAARAHSRAKPIVAYKAGRFAESAQAAASHTGALVGADDVCDAVFQRAGIERVFQIEDMFDCAELLARNRLPQGDRLAIVTNAGGPGVMATDALISLGGRLAVLGAETRQALNEFLPESWSHGNPVDVLGDADPARLGRAVQLVLQDAQVDAALVILTPQSMTDPTGSATRVAEIVAASRKPALSAWIGGVRVQAGRKILLEANVPSYDTPERAVRAFMHLVSQARNLETLYETPRELPLSFALDGDALRLRCTELLRGSESTLSEQTSKSLLETYGIPVAHTRAAATADEAVEQARSLGYPVALKVLSPQITHKTDVEGVALGLQVDDGVRAAFERIVAAARTHRPDARIDGVTVQRMVSAQNGVELIVGMKQDPTFGAIQMVGAGGITAELHRDRALGLPPLNERLARQMLESLRCWPLLQGYRGRPQVDVPGLIEVLMRLSYLIADHPQIQELDVNPLLVTPRGVVALDARIVVDRQREVSSARPYSHLAIRPYPDEYVRRVAFSGGPSLTLRPIRPEDEPRWLRLLESCSAESLHARFQALFKTPTHAMAIRYCVIDYDRELALVAQRDDTGEFGGVARLIADPDHQTAEFAILIADAWQGRGLGTLLTQNCLEVARLWGVREVTATTVIDNSRMIALFEQQGFVCRYDLQARVVFVSKSLERP